MKKYFYTVGFLYLMYFTFLTNYAINSLKSGNDLILKNFTLTGVFFSFIFILIYALRNFLYEAKKPYLKSILTYTNHTGLISFLVLIFSHFLATKNIIADYSFTLSRVVGLHQELLVFVFGLLFFILGIFVFKRSNHKVLGVCLMLLFLNGFYHLVIWHSYLQQQNITKDFYMVAVENNIAIKECGQNVGCIKFKNQKEQDDFFLNPQVNFSADLNNSVKKYLKYFNEEIKNNKNDTTTLSYGDSLRVFNNDEYAPIGVYSKANKYLIIDYASTKLLIQKSQTLYYHMIGVSTICWLFMLLLLLATHAYIPYYAKSKLKSNKPEEVK